MTPTELENYLREGIPLTRAMAISVVRADAETVLLQAPLAPNINQHGTMFGGSASAIAILAAWSLLHIRLHLAGRPAGIVIQRSTMDYLRPIHGDVLARAAYPPETPEWDQFLRMLTRKGKGRLELAATLEREGEVVGRLLGEFVAFSEPH